MSLDLMPRSQPAVRATALACLVLRRSYVSNSASPALIGVWKWFCSHRTGNARLLRPPCLRRTESHAENPTAKARSTYWRRAFAVPSTCVPCATGHVSVGRCACLYLRGTTPVLWRHHSRASHARTSPPCPEYMASKSPVYLKNLYSTLLNTVKTHQLTSRYPRRLGLLRLHLVAEGQRRKNLIMALIIRERQRLQGESRVRQYWVRPWIERLPSAPFGALPFVLGPISLLIWR